MHLPSAALQNDAPSPVVHRLAEGRTQGLPADDMQKHVLIHENDSRALDELHSQRHAPLLATAHSWDAGGLVPHIRVGTLAQACTYRWMGKSMSQPEWYCRRRPPSGCHAQHHGMFCHCGDAAWQPGLQYTVAQPAVPAQTRTAPPASTHSIAPGCLPRAATCLRGSSWAVA